ncbi:MAG TPA: hypothetical protein VKB13_06350 [Gaiellaceae bacterium]|nr:hypothetical protein [Gaiellaceae bacterium]
MRHELAAVIDRINASLDRLDRGENLDRAGLEHTLTDGYAWALALDAECDRLERRISQRAAELGHDDSAKHARDLSTLARLLVSRRRELASLRELLAVLRAGVQHAHVA